MFSNKSSVAAEGITLNPRGANSGRTQEPRRPDLIIPILALLLIFEYQRKPETDTFFRPKQPAVDETYLSWVFGPTTLATGQCLLGDKHDIFLWLKHC